MTSPRLARVARSALLVPLALVAVAAVGCIQSDTKTTILADGSGTCSDTTVIDIAKTKELIEMAKAFGAAGGGAPGGMGSIPQGFDAEKQMIDALYGEAALKAQLAACPGIAVKSVSSEVKDGKRTAKREFAFSDFGALGKILFTTGTAELKKNEDGSYTLEMDAIGLIRGMMGAAGAQAGGPGAAGGFGGADGLMFFAQMIPDLKVKREFTLPGAILETDGKKADDGKTVSWTFSAEDLMKAGSDVSKAPGKMSVKFKGEGLTLKPFKFTPDLEDLKKSMEPKPAAPPPTTTEPTKPGEPAKPPEPTTPK